MGYLGKLLFQAGNHRFFRKRHQLDNKSSGLTYRIILVHENT